MGSYPGLLVSLAHCLVVGSLVFSPSPAQEETKEERVWHFGDEAISLPLLLDVCSAALGVHIEYDPAEVSGKVLLRMEPDYSDSEVWSLLNRELADLGMATVQPPGAEALRVVALDQAAGLARLEPELDKARAGFVKALVELEHRQADTLVPLVQLMISEPGGAVTALKDGNALVVSDRVSHVQQILAMLSLLDAAEVEPLIEEIPLRHTSATALSSLVDRVVNTRKAVTGSDVPGKLLPLPDTRSVLVLSPPDQMGWWREMVARFDRPEPVTTIHYSPRRFGLAETASLIDQVVKVSQPEEPWRMVRDELTGSLIITTTASRHEEIQDLLTRLSATEAGPRKPLRAYVIHNRQVSEVLDLLQGLLEAGVLNPESRDPPQGDVARAPRGPTAAIPVNASAVVGSPPKEGESRVVLAADEPTNRILAFGEARVLDQLGVLIESLDVRNAQVLVEVLVVSLSDSQTHDLGVELQKVGTINGAGYQLGSLFGLGSPDPNGLGPSALGGSGFSGVVLDPGDFSALVRALETVNHGRTLTIPKVLVNNNQEASLDSVLQTPFASTNASNTVATTSFGGTLDAGTTISVKPQVADGDQIVMDYTVSLSNFVGDAADPALPPPRQENRLQSVVTVPDGHTVVIGGLEIESESDASSRVPILGSIPIVRNLFQNRSRSKSLNRFFVFLRCSVMRAETFEDLRYMSSADIEVAGVDDGWPVLEPRIIR